MTIKIALILTIITIVTYVITKLCGDSMDGKELANALIYKEYPPRILFITSIFLLSTLATIVAWIVAIIKF